MELSSEPLRECFEAMVLVVVKGGNAGVGAGAVVGGVEGSGTAKRSRPFYLSSSAATRPGQQECTAPYPTEKGRECK